MLDPEERVGGGRRGGRERETWMRKVRVMILYEVGYRAESGLMGLVIFRGESYKWCASENR